MHGFPSLSKSCEECCVCVCLRQKLLSFIFFFLWNSSPLPIFFFILSETGEKEKQIFRDSHIGSSILGELILSQNHFTWFLSLRLVSRSEISTNIYDCARNCNPIQITLVLGVLWQIGLILISNMTPRIKEEKYYTEFKYRIKRKGRGKVKSFNQWIIFKKYFFQFLFLLLHFVNFRNIVRIFHLLTLKTFNELKMLFTLSLSLSLFAFFSIALDSSRNSFNSHEVYRETKKDLK